ncbi:hypothetical protein QFZ43_003231 [Streptomyces afghaniensis]|nr:hypothetical protein [Streptomyces afghaniensis]
MRPRVLPDNAKLLMLDAAGLTHAQIADEYKVSRQAVTKRFNAMGEYSQASNREVTAALPWDLRSHPAKGRLKDSEEYLGLRAFLRERMNLPVSPRSRLALKSFMNHIERGEVFDLDQVKGVRYVRRERRDGSLVIRWPEGVPQDERTALFRLSPAHEASSP